MPLRWLTYWDGTPAPFICKRHREAHDFDVAFAIVKVLDSPKAHVLDFGCGEATRAQFVANRCAKLYLWDGVPSMRQTLRQRHGEHPAIVVLDEDWRQAIAPESLDLVVLNSVVQYLAREYFEDLLDAFKPLLKPHARLLVSDVIPPGVGAMAETLELLKYAHRESFLRQALKSLLAPPFAGHLRGRGARASRYSAQTFAQILEDHGFAVRRLARNIGHNQRRMAFLAERVAWKTPNPAGLAALAAE